MREICRITHPEGAAITGEVDHRAQSLVDPQNFRAGPIFPGTLLMEAAGQLVALWSWAQGQRGRPRLVRTSAEFHYPVGPANDHLLLRAEVRRKRHLNFATIGIWAAGTQVATLEAVLAVLPAAA